MYVLGMFLMRVITALFFIGLAGSAIVVAISFVEDFRELFGPDEPELKASKPLPPAPNETASRGYDSGKSQALGSTHGS